jgi:hypothetical protein
MTNTSRIQRSGVISKTGGLVEGLHAELEHGHQPGDPGPAMMAYWLFCGSPWQDQLGYNEARQQHYAELTAVKLPLEFQPRNFKTRAEADATFIELLFRPDSLASWIEAQESWVFGEHGAGIPLHGIVTTRERDGKQ